jgi:hypothetical protein
LSTTFDDVSFPDRRPGEHWRQSDGLADNNVGKAGDGISGYGGWKHLSEDHILAAANNPAGGGGKGFRHYRGNGQNRGGGGLFIALSSPVSEVWVRWYMRYQEGFSWLNGAPHYIKDHYWRGNNQPIFGVEGARSWGFYARGAHPSSLTWIASQGGQTGSGKFDCYEYHIDQKTGTLEFWFNGARYLRKTGLNLGAPGLQGFILGSNQNAVVGADTLDFYTDYDDLAISTSGRIGCL